jgi:hypothetical protein
MANEIALELVGDLKKNTLQTGDIVIAGDETFIIAYCGARGCETLYKLVSLKTGSSHRYDFDTLDDVKRTVLNANWSVYRNCMVNLFPQEFIVNHGVFR